MQNVALIGIELGKHSFHVHVRISPATHYCGKSSREPN